MIRAQHADIRILVHGVPGFKRFKIRESGLESVQQACHTPRAACIKTNANLAIYGRYPDSRAFGS